MNNGIQGLLTTPQDVSGNELIDSDVACLPRHHTMNALGPSIALEVVSTPLIHVCSKIRGFLCCTDGSVEITWPQLAAHRDHRK